MGAPARYPCHGEDGGVELGGDLQHGVDEPGVEINIGAHALVHLALLADDFGGDAGDFFVVFVVLLQPFGNGELLGVVAQDVRARVAERVDRVPYAVDEPRAVERLFVEDAGDIVADGVVRAGGGRLDVLEHFGHLDVGAAVTGTFQRAEGRRHRGIGVRPGAGDDVVGEGGVVAAAVFGVQDEAEVEHLGFELAVLPVRTDETEDVFRRTEVGARLVDDEAVVRVIVRIHLIAVGGEQGELRDELDALPEHIGDGDVVGVLVVAIKCEHAARDDVHHVRRRRLHDDVAYEALGQSAVGAEHLGEVRELLLVGERPEEQKIGGLLKAEALLVGESVHEVLDGDAAVEEFAGALHAVAVLVEVVGVDLADLGESRDDAGAVDVAQTALYVILLIKRRVDSAAFHADFAHLAHPWRIMCDGFFELFHALISFSVFRARERFSALPSR